MPPFDVFVITVASLVLIVGSEHWEQQLLITGLGAGYLGVWGVINLW